jgi:hypothetical protein
MRWVNQPWQQLQNKAVKFNTVPGGQGARIGIVQSAYPRYDGTVDIHVQYRVGRRNWQSAKMHSQCQNVAVLAGHAHELAMRTYRKHNAIQQFKNVGRGWAGHLGADPELFALGKDDRILPAWEFLPDKTADTAAFWDGFQAEFTTETETCLAWFLDHVRKGLQRVHKSAKKKGGRLLLADVVEVPLDILEKAEEKHVRFGCDPSKNVYNDGGELQADPRQLQVRFAGGHMHFGMGELQDKNAFARCVKALDAIWGVASVSMFETLEHPLRRVYYGKAGEYRLPKHGLEYRTPSNAWMCHPAIAHLSWMLARSAVQVGLIDALGAWQADEDETRQVINELNVIGARRILERNHKQLTTLLEGYFKSNHSRIEGEKFEALRPIAVKQGIETIMNGVGAVVEAPKDLVKNWMLDAPTDTDQWAKPTDEDREKDIWYLHTESGRSQWMLAAEAISKGQRL